MSNERGLPTRRQMRHDSHFVEELTAARSESIGKMVDIERIEPNPHQPRKNFGDLSEMVASVKEKGILEPILVRSHGAGYQIIAGERRYQAARQAGLQRVPCIEVDVDERGVLEISLIENLQRRDLGAFEEAAALHRLTEQFRYTHDEIARKLGKSRTVITETLSLNRIPDEIRDRCRHADIVSKSMLLEIVRQPSLPEMHRLLDKITGDGIGREEARQFNREGGRRPRRFTYSYAPDDETFRFQLSFPRPEVDGWELIAALQRVLARLQDEVAADPQGAAGRPRGGAKRPADDPSLRASAD